METAQAISIIINVLFVALIVASIVIYYLDDICRMFNFSAPSKETISKLFAVTALLPVGTSIVVSIAAIVTIMSLTALGSMVSMVYFVDCLLS